MAVLLAFSCALINPTVGYAQAAAGQESQKRVLVLHDLRRDSAVAAGMEDVYRRILAAALGAQLDYYSEYVDQYRFAQPEYQTALRAYLRGRYAKSPPHVVIATTTATLRLARTANEDLFPGVPIVFHAGKGVSPAPHSTGVVSTIDFSSTLELALAFHPAVKLVAVISGASAYDKGYGDLARAQFRGFENRVSFSYLYGLPMADLEQAVARLPRDAIIYYLSVSEDGAGQRFVPFEVLDSLSAQAPLPIYGFPERFLGHGVVGGRLFSSNVVAEHTAALALRVLRGEAAERIPVTEIDSYVTQFDWRQLRRWNISEARLPAGSVVLFRELSTWDRHKPYIVGAMVLLILQTGLIAALLVHRRRRRVAERVVRNLAGRLISAQEAERTRIARDLHDDACQEVAGIAVDISNLQHRRDTGNDAVQMALSSLHARTASVAENLRLLSHDLHPSVLQHLGLVAALEAHCAEVDRHHDIQVSFSAEGEVDPFVPAVALSLFRITQEALRNAARHGHARHATVALLRQDRTLTLTIADDGEGFDLESARHNGGLGLISIEERARLVDGRVTIRSEPTKGTTIDVRVPIRHGHEREQVHEERLHSSVGGRPTHRGH
jgi:signal transduction histidine kinase